MSRRIGPVFSRDSATNDRGQNLPDWFQEYARNIDRQAVHSGDQDRSMFDQISEIMGTKSKFSTVEDAVRDMRERTGLTEFLSKATKATTAANAEAILANVKCASEDDNLEVSLPADTEQPSIFKDHPKIEKFIAQYIKSRKGHTSVASVMSDIGRIFKEIDTVHLDDKNLKHFISEKILEELQLNPAGTDMDVEMLGSVDKGNDQDYALNNDAFSSLLPAKF